MPMGKLLYGSFPNRVEHTGLRGVGLKQNGRDPTSMVRYSRN
jgi:hypothetical protein